MKCFRTVNRFILSALTVFILISCVKNHSLEITPITYGNVILTFSNRVGGESLKFDTLAYRTSLGNRYLVNDLQYFISGVSLHRANGNWQGVTTGNGIRYIDGRDNYSSTWWLNDLFPAGVYDTVAFTFGMDEKQNISGFFNNPPERDMFWPEILGGGYHYMKLNLKWQNDTMVQPMPFMFHLGIGQVYASSTPNPDSITGFVQNYFKIKLPCKLTVTDGRISHVIFQMNIDKWFDGQNAFNFYDYPNGIMQNQEGMYKACLNGRNAFDLVIPQ
jgi:hypothetical protein